jgi:hypothetical protein
MGRGAQEERAGHDKPAFVEEDKVDELLLPAYRVCVDSQFGAVICVCRPIEEAPSLFIWEEDENSSCSLNNLVSICMYTLGKASGHQD